MGKRFLFVKGRSILDIVFPKQSCLQADWRLSNAGPDGGKAGGPL
jgi:hypothetical protein